jgi:heterodisulfide reductase subunit B2
LFPQPMALEVSGMTTTKSATDKSLLQAVQDETGENASLCYFCKKCTAGCPLSEHMDVAPHQVMRSVQLDRKDAVLASKTIWICASCQTCVTRCPQQLDLPRIMDSLKMMANEQGVKSPVPSVSAFNESTMRWIGWTGRSYEPGLIAEMNLRGKQLTKDMGLGIKLIARGKLKLLPDHVSYSPPRKRPEIAPDDSTVSYYPGCSLHSTSKDYEQSVHAAMEAIGLKLEEPKGWLCCGSAAAHSTSHLQAAALPMKNLALVRAAGRGRVTTPCPACYSRMKSAVRDVEGDSEFAEQVDRETGYAWDGQVTVENLLDTVVDRVGIDGVAAKVTRPLDGLKVVCYYGCLLTRPSQLTGADEAEYPMKMDRLARALGAEVLDWSYKTECCGASLAVTKTELAVELSARILQNARDVGADAVVAACPLCHINLDTRQDQMARDLGRKFDLPVIYFTQLMGLAFGIKADKLGLKKHMVSPMPLLKRKMGGEE